MPALPVSLLDPMWAQFAALLPPRPVVAPTHPLGCHRRADPDRVVFEHVVAALVHGSGYERIASPGCSDARSGGGCRSGPRRDWPKRCTPWCCAQYDRMIGLDWTTWRSTAASPRRPAAARRPGRSPVDRGKQGLKRSTVTDADGVPLHLVSAGANRHDAPLLGPTLAGLGKLGPLPADATVHLDRAYDGAPPARCSTTRLRRRHRPQGRAGPAPGRPALGGRANPGWMNGYGKLRRCTEKPGRSSTSTSSSPPPSSSSAASSNAPAPATAGPPPHHPPPQVTPIAGRSETALMLEWYRTCQGRFHPTIR